MKIKEIITAIEDFAPAQLQESWDNTGLQAGDAAWACTGVLCSLDVTEDVVAEAIAQGCNLIVAHHPLLFKGLKAVSGKTYVERTLIAALKHDIAIYAAHTSLDNVAGGVNGMIAQKLGLTNTSVLSPKTDVLRRLVTFVPLHAAEAVRQALFAAGGGRLGNYSECSFNSDGTGTFKGEAGAQPYVGTIGSQHREAETKIEMVFGQHLQPAVIEALFASHPYEEVAFDIVALKNTFNQFGSGLIGSLTEAVPEEIFLKQLANIFKTPCIRHTKFTGKDVQKVALCGGSGAFLINEAARQGAQVYITADVKYHEFFDADDRLVIADVGHWESEQYTVNLLHDLVVKKFPTFAVRKTTVNTNPVQYYL